MNLSIDDSSEEDSPLTEKYTRNLQIIFAPIDVAITFFSERFVIEPSVNFVIDGVVP